MRLSIFPDKSLRPKHHYLAHYPWLILQFGPLIRVWTLRFESKHSYFKKCARYSMNFINICHTFAIRHQLLQAYMRNGTLFGSSANLENAIEFNVDLYNDNIKAAFEHHHSMYKGVVTSLKGVINGVQYEKGLYIVIASTNHSIILGEIVMLIQHKAGNVCFLVKRAQASYEHKMGYYKLYQNKLTYECFSAANMKSYACLPAYKVSHNSKIVVLKHAILNS